ncbi:type II toxin-antitoxin system HicB family antitoxin [archaeon]|nr:type II toxin-antitoxin system HicB family antitoxin [archaeon]
MDNFKVDVVINEEKLSNKKTIFVAHCNALNVTSQGKTIEEARKNLKEAVGIEIKECPEKLELLSEFNEPIFTTIEVPTSEITNYLRPATC